LDGSPRSLHDSPSKKYEVSLMEPNQPYNLKVQELHNEITKHGLDTTRQNHDLINWINVVIMDELNSKDGNDPHLKMSNMEVDKRRENNNCKMNSIDEENTDSVVGGQKIHKPPNK